MPVEIEAKIKVDDFETVRSALRERGAEPVGEFLETNIFFDTEDRALLAADEGLRLRRSRDARNGKAHCTLAYKGPRHHGELKSRREIELHVGSPEDAAALLECLGFSQTLSFEKKRESWRFGECSVELDELPRLGRFVEIEADQEEAVFNARESLGLADRPLVKASYVAMLITELQERGDTEREVVFAPTEQDLDADTTAHAGTG